MNRINIGQAVLWYVLTFFSFGNLFGQVDTITSKNLAAKTVLYEKFKDVSLSTSVKYAGLSAVSPNNGAIRFRWKSGGETGLVTTYSAQEVKSVQIKWDDKAQDGRKLVVYGKNTAYKSTDAFNENYNWGVVLTEINNGDQSVHDISSKGYQYIGIRAKSDVVYLKSIAIKWTKLKRNIHFEKNIYEVNDGEHFVAPTLNETANYSSSDEGVAIVNTQSGEVTIKGCGTTTILATLPETEKYQEEVVKYTLMVQPVHTKKAFIDFSNYQKWLPGYKLDELLPNIFSFHEGDLEVVITSGDQPSRFSMCEKEQKVGLLLSPNAKVELRLPDGFKMIKSYLWYSYKNGTIDWIKDQMFTNAIYQTTGESGESSVATLDVDYIGTYKIKIGNAEHATFSGTQAYVMPKGLQGGIVKVDEVNGKANVSYCVHPEDVVPAQQALILKGEPGEYTLVPTPKPGMQINENSLLPVFTNNEIKAPDQHRLYVLSRKEGKLGFFWQQGSNEGLNVRNIANKAYLQLPMREGAGGKGYLLGIEESTGIDCLVVPITENDAVYTLAGVRVSCPVENLPQGIYIIGGKKIYLK